MCLPEKELALQVHGYLVDVMDEENHRDNADSQVFVLDNPPPDAADHPAVQNEPYPPACLRTTVPTAETTKRMRDCPAGAFTILKFAAVRLPRRGPSNKTGSCLGLFEAALDFLG